MFTGIVTEVGSVVSNTTDHLTVRASHTLNNLVLGGSIAVNGACLTATAITDNYFTVGLSPETLQRTNLGQLQTDDPVNLERPLSLGGELGGHLVQGHIDGLGQIIDIIPQDGATKLRIQASPEVMRYIVDKGFIAVEGISLTVTFRGTDHFEISLIEYSRNNTNMQTHRVGDTVNLEVDIIAKYVEQYLKAQRSNITLEFLKENGF